MTPQIKPGKPIPGYSLKTDGTIVLDSVIVELLKNYRSNKVFSNSGGYRKLRIYLRRDHGILINKKKVYRLCFENNLLLPKRKKSKKHKRLCNNHLITKPNQLWQFDIKYGFIHGTNQTFYLLAFVDVYTKIVVSYHVGLTCKALNLKMTLQLAFDKLSMADKSSLTIRSDNGTQMSSNEFKKYVEANTLNHEFTPIRCPNKNAFIESFFSIYEVEFLQTRYFKNFKDAYLQTSEWMEWYNFSRVHGSIFDLAPKEFENNFYDKTTELIKISA